MTGDRRNTAVVFALVTSMTVGAAALLWLERQLVPEKPNWSASTLLMAERGVRVEEVVISYAPRSADLDVLQNSFDARDSVCWIPAGGAAAPWDPRGPRVQVVVIGSDADVLEPEQKRTLLGALGSLSEMSGMALVPVRLAASSDARRDPALPPQAKDLWKFLVRKGIIE